MFYFRIVIYALISALFIFCDGISAEEVVGRRPYEMVEAGRTEDSHPALIDFESLEGWTTETTAAEATFVRTREKQLWGDYVAELTYRSTSSESPCILVKPPKPISIEKGFDCVNFWVHGNNWSWRMDATTPRVELFLHMQATDGSLQRYRLASVGWMEWHMLHKKFSRGELDRLGDRPAVAALEIRNGTNKDFRTIYFDNLSFYKEALGPLSFEPRPKRGIDLPEGQTTGTNTGPGRLPFPNREETILPKRIVADFKNSLSEREKGKSYLLRYEAEDGVLEWIYAPRTGRLDDLHGTWMPAGDRGRAITVRFQNAGPKFSNEISIGEKTPESIRIDGDRLDARWKLGECEVNYAFQIRQKSLIVDIQCPGGSVEEVVFGKILGLTSPQTITVPYLTAGYSRTRPQVLMDASGKSPLFILPLVDHARSNASELFFVNRTESDGVVLGGSRYHEKTDGKRNDCFERLFVNLSSNFEEVLPDIPNDPSPYRETTAERVWRIYGAENLDDAYRYWKRIRRYGVEKMMVVDHEVFWRDGGESFTFRTKSAPGKGGDEKRKEYVRKMHGLGYIYGPYNNFTDFAPVNARWNEDWVTRQSNGDWKPAWARCYNPKPAIAVQVEPHFSQTAQKKFGFNGGYCDVHTAVAPWVNVDYDARVPGAGTFAATFYAYGEILLNQKRSWTGPVYSEGPAHWFYSGLADGNFGHDVTYRIVDNPWLVDFDLLKIHPLENNCGMGYLGHFFGKQEFPGIPDKPRALDRFLAATLAFGHIGYLGMETGFAGGIRSYFATQQLQCRYAKQNVKSIRYADADGRYLDTSQALAVDAVKLNRLRIVYEDGLTLYINGNAELDWDCRDDGKKIADLPVDGWFVVDPQGELRSWNLEKNGKREHYVESPAYLFAEVRNNAAKTPCRFDRLICDRQLIVLKNVDEQGRSEMIVGEPDYEARSTVHAVRLDADADADAVALDFERKPIGPAETRYSRGMVHVMPVEGAFSYLLTPRPVGRPAIAMKRIEAAPGESLDLSVGNTAFTYKVPQDAEPGTFSWIERDGCCVDIDIVPLCGVKANLVAPENRLDFAIRSHLAETQKFQWTLEDPQGRKTRKEFELEPSKTALFSADAPKSDVRSVQVLKLTAKTENGLRFEKEYRLKTDFSDGNHPLFPDRLETGYCYRGGQPVPLDGVSSAYAYKGTVPCAPEPRHGWLLHPPFQGGVGYVFLLSDSVAVPDEEGIAFYSEVGIRNTIQGKTDGVLFRVFVLEPEKGEVLAGEILCSEKQWTPLICDLSPWKGKTVRLRLVADVGPNDNSNCDAACWSEFQWISTLPAIRSDLFEEPVSLTYVSPENPSRSPADFTNARKVELVFEGCSVNNDSEHFVEAKWNGLSIGRLPAARGDEKQGGWTTRSLLLSEEAVKSLDVRNHLELRSRSDHFKIRRCRLVAEFPDGTRRTSFMTDRTITHPGTWKYAEGESVSLKSPVRIDIIIPTEKTDHPLDPT